MSGFFGRDCRAQGERFPGCPLDRIDAERLGSRHSPLPATPANRHIPPPGFDPLAGFASDPRDATIAEFREVLAGYVERDAQNQRLLADATRRIAMLEQVLAGRDAELAQVKATRDRYQTNGKRVNAEKREMEALLRRPEVKRALQKAVHRDAHPGASPTQLLTYDQDFIKLTAIYQRIESSQ